MNALDQLKLVAEVLKYAKVQVDLNRATTVIGLVQAVDALADGSGDPKRCAPPEALSHIQHHWLKSERSSMPAISEWLGGQWFTAGQADPISALAMAERGWEYDKPCIYR